MLIQDKVQGVSHSVVNEDFAAQGGQRRHVLYMPRSTADQRRYTGEYQQPPGGAGQVLRGLAVKDQDALPPGDRVSLSLSRLGLSGTYDVVSARSRMDGSGERTEMTLSVR